jgi:hypothetical protein
MTTGDAPLLRAAARGSLRGLDGPMLIGPGAERTSRSV